ncbi:dTDP-glucose 4,6-dehydratase [Streptomyces albidoflavus]|uniref:dTDP-glucose 4,6-dehydratase n=1 Tax=Streptomyces sp. YN86 TaxID=1484062 RepID=A0A075F2A7_9ACTN|nr:MULTISPECIES: dTDP-glucose 4,6-dehydratase [Streptomyces]AIE54242.1 PauY22 [Streptomyces sp. YN86]RZE68447.1 dTDP-glucose 4,6-dehydratase [Streptomyces albidoflavus]RZE84675.1 dTDP-glucose 4,6-dehydratase [Streptomyces albidoflavus]UKL03472.1 dTDP-glucose 4,6-dehydratase [Streptomyces sp. NBU3104]
MHVLVTGGAGFIGSHYVRMLLSRPGSRGLTITVLDKLSYAGNPANLAEWEADERFRFRRGDICDRALLDEVLPGADCVVHLAAESHVDRSIEDGDVFLRTNVLGTQRLLEASLRHGVGKFVHVSTDEVYGSIDQGSWPETDPLRPNSPYSASKASSDLLVLAFHRTHGLDVSVTRCSNNYGPMQYPEKVVPLFLTRLIDGLPVPLYGDGRQVRDWLHVEDHCHGIELVRSGGRPGEVYNLGGGTELSNRDLTERLLAVTGSDWSSVRRVPDRKGHDLRYSVDWSKAREELGYLPTRDFASGLEATARWYRDHPGWWRPLGRRLPKALSGSV